MNRKLFFYRLNYFFLVAFLLSVAVQYNDPDPYVWVALYLLASVMCVATICRQQLAWLPGLLVLVSICWIAYLLPSIVGQVSIEEVVESISMKTQEVEEAREIGGLMLVGLWALLTMMQGR